MSWIPEDFTELFSHRNESELRLTFWMSHPNTFGSLQRLTDADRRAAEEIAEAEKYIRLLKEYRQALFVRSQSVTTATLSPVLKFWRKKGYYDNKVIYHLEYCLRSSDTFIEDHTEFRESFTGTERAKAFRRFAELKKQFPLVPVEQNTQKERWEK